MDRITEQLGPDLRTESLSNYSGTGPTSWRADRYVGEREPIRDTSLTTSGRCTIVQA